MSNNLPAIKQWYDKNLPAMAQLWGSEADAKRLFLSFHIVTQKNPKILECDPKSLQLALLQACELRLSFGLGEVAIVPRRNTQKGIVEAQLLPQYQGLVKLAIQSGCATSVEAEVVYDGDKFDYQQGSDAYIHHKKALDNRGKVIATWAKVQLPGGGCHFEILTEAEIGSIRGRSQAAGKGYSPWSTDADEMRKKTAIKRALKTMPKSVELARAIALDNAIERPDLADISQTTDLNQKLLSSKEEVSGAVEEES